jgi:hypothetical protein
MIGERVFPFLLLDGKKEREPDGLDLMLGKNTPKKIFFTEKQQMITFTRFYNQPLPVVGKAI